MEGLSFQKRSSKTPPHPVGKEHFFYDRRLIQLVEKLRKVHPLKHLVYYQLSFDMLLTTLRYDDKECCVCVGLYTNQGCLSNPMFQTPLS